jgi:hypothetical protein
MNALRRQSPRPWAPSTGRRPPRSRRHSGHKALRASSPLEYHFGLTLTADLGNLREPDKAYLMRAPSGDFQSWKQGLRRRTRIRTCNPSS